MDNLEQEWLTQAWLGNPEAFFQIVERYQRSVYNLCFRMLGDHYEAEDAAQEAFLRAYLHIKKYDEHRSFSTWLLSIAAHYCIDQIRKRRMQVLSIDANPYLEIQDGTPSPEASFGLAEDQQQVHKLLDSLAPQDRAAVILRFWYELSYEEIAEALSLTVSAVKSRLHRSRLALAENLVENEHQTKMKERARHESPAY